MKKFLTLLIFAATLLSCERVETIKSVDNDPVRNFEAMWQIIDDHYIFTRYKGVDWDKVREDMLPRVEQVKDEFELFDIMVEALALLRDGHVTLVSDFQMTSSDFKVDKDGNRYPTDYVSGLVSSHYLTEDYYSRNGFTFGYIERNGGKYAYFHHPSFTKDLAAVDLEYIGKFVEASEGLIIDIRNNGGGNGQYGLDVASHFFDERTLVGYSAKKAAVGSDELTDFAPIYVAKANTHDWSKVPTVLLINRDVYSTANLFASIMSYAENVTLVGGRSGGGGGLPITYMLPNGWAMCCPSNILVNREKEWIEDGVAPDYEVHITDADEESNRDSLVEKAIELLSAAE